MPTDGILENVDPLALDNAHAEAMYLLSIDAADADAADAVDAAPKKRRRSWTGTRSSRRAWRWA